MEGKSFDYAGFWRRFAASVIDGVLILYFCSGLKWMIADILNAQGILNFDEAQKFAYFLWSFYLIFIRWCYFAGMESSPIQATLGKVVVGLYVANEKGERVSFGQATGRFFGKILSGLILFIGYLMAGFTEKKQALHDQLSHCLVLKK